MMHFYSLLQATCLVVILNSQDSIATVLSDIRNIFAFGDSYTSEGWNGQSDPLTPYGRWCSTAGPPWARQFADLIEQPLYNLAVSGATSNKDIVYASPTDFRGQVNYFQAYIPGRISWTAENSVFMIAFGTNDINNSYKTDTDGVSLHNRVLNSYFETVDRLYVSGARQFVFNNVVPFDRAQTGISQGPVLQAKLRDRILDFNGQLSLKAANYCATKSGILCIVFDTHSHFTDVMNNYQQYGYATPDGICPSYAARSSCQVEPAVDSSCLSPIQSYIWKDGLHPSYAIDTTWAQGLFIRIGQEG